MPYISWTPEWSVEITAFDQQHRRLVDLINQVHEAMRARKSEEVIERVLGELVVYTKTHFAAEETLMATHAYPDLAAHRGEHQALIDKVTDFQEKRRAKMLMLSVDLLEFLTAWLKNHIQKTDKKYGLFFAQKGLT